MTVEAVELNGVAEYVSWVLDREGPDLMWFRGQGCETRQLRTSLSRKLDPYTSANMISTETRLITRFRQRSLPLWPEGYPQDDWEQLFAMQHFGVPTRLLDWSESALVAAYFAATHDPKLCECGTGNCQPTIWVLDPVGLNRFNSRLDGMGDAISVLATSSPDISSWTPGTEETRFAPWPIAIHGTHNSTRIVAQQGTFTVAGKNGDPLDEVPAVIDHPNVLVKLTFSIGHQEIMRVLSLLGVTRSTVFPELASVAHDIAVREWQK